MCAGVVSLLLPFWVIILTVIPEKVNPEERKTGLLSFLCDAPL